MTLQSVQSREVRNIVERLLIPLFQRLYEWKYATIKRFFDSILDAFYNALDNPGPHDCCIGTLTLGNWTNRRAIIIDAKQRIMTILFFLAAYVRNRNSSQQTINEVEAFFYPVKSEKYKETYVTYENENDTEYVFLLKLFDFNDMTRKWHGDRFVSAMIHRSYMYVERYIKENPEKADVLYDIIMGKKRNFRFVMVQENWDGTMEEYRRKYEDMNRVYQEHTNYQKTRIELTKAWGKWEGGLDKFDRIFDEIRKKVGDKANSEKDFIAFALHCLYFAAAENSTVSFTNNYAKEYNYEHFAKILLGDNCSEETCHTFFKKYFTPEYYYLYKTRYLSPESWLRSTAIGKANSDLHINMYFLQSLIDDNNPNQHVCVTIAMRKLFDECFSGGDGRCTNPTLLKKVLSQGIPAIHARLFDPSYGGANTLHNILTPIVRDGWAIGIDQLPMSESESKAMVYAIQEMTYCSQKQKKRLLKTAIAFSQTKDLTNWRDDLYTLLEKETQIDHIVEQQTINACKSSDELGTPNLEQYKAIHNTIANLRLVSPMENADAKALEHGELENYDTLVQRGHERALAVVNHPFFSECVKHVNQ